MTDSNDGINLVQNGSFEDIDYPGRPGHHGTPAHHHHHGQGFGRGHDHGHHFGHSGHGHASYGAWGHSLFGHSLFGHALFGQPHFGNAEVSGWMVAEGPGPDVVSHPWRPAADGKTYIELDGSGARDTNSAIYQDIPTDGTGTFTLSFSYAAPAFSRASSNGIEVIWNGEVIDTIALDGGRSVEWQTYTYEVAGAGDATRLEFRAVGRDDARGGYLNNVSVVARPEPEDPLFTEANDTVVLPLDDPNYGDGRIYDALGGHDNVTGGELDDTILGGAGRDTLAGGGGNDTLEGNGGADLLSGDAGDDTLSGGGGGDWLDGGSGNDQLSGGGGDDTLSGGDGNDVLKGGADNDVLSGDAGDDALAGGDGNDMLAGRIGNDSLSGGDGDDLLDGGDGDDHLNGQVGNDALTAGLGADAVYGGGGDDWVDGGDGDDQLFGDAGTDTLFGGPGADTLDGGGGIDTLHGGDGNDIVLGAAGADVIFGGAGNDSLQGEGGADWIIGGAGADFMIGGGGGDTFVFDLSASVPESGIGAGNRDIVKNFQADNATGVSDTIEFTGVSSFSYVGDETHDFTGDGASGRYNSQTKLLEIDADGDFSVDMEIDLRHVDAAYLDDSDFSVS